MKREKVAVILLAMVLVTGTVAGCGGQAKENAAVQTQDSIKTEETNTEKVNTDEPAVEGTIKLVEGEWKDVYFNEEYQDEGMLNVKGEEITAGGSYLLEESGMGLVVLDSWEENGSENIGNHLNSDTLSSGQVAIVFNTDTSVEQFYEVYEDSDSSNEEIRECYEKMIKDGFPVFGIYSRAEGDSAPLFSDSDYGTRFANAEKIGNFEGKEYYFVYNDVLPAEGFSETELKDIQVMLDSLEDIRANLILFPEHEHDYEAEKQEMKEQAAGISMSQFETTDIEGNTVTQDILKDYDVTMVNVWATWCGPCRKELPDIAAAYEKLPENANIISICEDAAEEGELAKELAEKAGMKYAVLVAGDELTQSVMEYVSAFPTTFLVDSEGNLVGTPLIGVPSDEDVTQYYLDYINSGLEQ